MPSKEVENKRKIPKQKRSKELVSSILTAAARVLEKRGFDNSTTNRIAEVAGVSIGSLYQYFPNKDELIGALIERKMEKSYKDALADLDKMKDFTDEKLIEKLISVLLDMVYGQTRYFKMLTHLAPKLDRIAFVAKIRMAAIDQLAEVVASRSKRLRPRDPWLAAFVIDNAVMGVVEAALYTGKIDEIPREVMEEELRELAKRYLIQPGV